MEANQTRIAEQQAQLESLSQTSREAMERAGVTRDQLAEAMGVDPKSVWRWTNKGVVPRRIGMKARVADVLGVDEADIVKTDGLNIYALAGGELVISRAWPISQAEQLGKIAIDGIAKGMYLLDEDDMVVVVSELWWEQPDPISGDFIRYTVSSDVVLRKEI